MATNSHPSHHHRHPIDQVYFLLQLPNYCLYLVVVIVRRRPSQLPSPLLFASLVLEQRVNVEIVSSLFL